MSEYVPEGKRIFTRENQAAINSESRLYDAVSARVDHSRRAARLSDNARSYQFVCHHFFPPLLCFRKSPIDIIAKSV